MNFKEIKKEICSTQIELCPEESKALNTVVFMVDTLFHLNAGGSLEEKRLIENLRSDLIDFEKLCVKGK